MDKLSVEIWLDVEPKRRVVIDDIGEIGRLSEVSGPTVSVKLTVSSPGARMSGSVSVYTEPTRTVIVGSTVKDVVTAYRRLKAGESPEQVYVPTSKTAPAVAVDHRHHPARRSSAPDYYDMWDGDGIVLGAPHCQPNGDGIDFLESCILPS